MVQQLQVVSSDANARFLELGFNKSVAIDLPRDVREVLVADPKTVTVVVRTMRRVYITGAVMGNTNVFFYDDDGRQIAAWTFVCRNTTTRAMTNRASTAKE